MRRIDENTNSKRYSHLRLFFFIALVFSINIQAQVTIGSSLPPAEGALFDLKQWDDNNGGATADKGLKITRVELVGAESLEPLASDNATQKAIHKGTIVYHVKSGVSTMEEGLYFWDSTQWLKISNEVPILANSVQRMNLISDVNTIFGDHTGDGGAVLTFPSLTMPDKGSYAFFFRFYGAITNRPTTAPFRSVFYMSVWKGETLVDIAEINMVVIGNTNMTYSITLAGAFEKGDNVTFKMAEASIASWTLRSGTGVIAANRTSVVWWKL